MRDYFSEAKLLTAPTKRAAFSDRTAYVMAEMSRLAYFRFEGGYNLSEIVEKVKELLPDHKNLAAVVALVQTQGIFVKQNDSKAFFSQILKENGFSLVDTFSDTGTGAQAFLCTQAKQGIAVLAFRGTELSLKDIKADVKARLVSVDSGGKVMAQGHVKRSMRIHSGYLEQFDSIRSQIERCLGAPEVSNLQLYITGHSLGGALAIVATKFLASDISGACYTFGSPPVGTKDFDYDIKTPIYRVVNHVDIVPRLPSPTMVLAMRILALAIGILLGPFTTVVSQLKENSWYDKLCRFILDAQKYRQSGYDSYLVGDSRNVRLRRSVGPYDRVVWWLKQFPNLLRGEFKLLSDHSIDNYSRKLAMWAKNRP